MHLPHIGIADRRELKEIAAMAQHWNVDLVVNTGDLFCHNIQPLIHSVIAGFDKYVGSIVPWTFAWGNHDRENITARSLQNNLIKLNMFWNICHIVYIARHEHISINYLEYLARPIRKKLMQ